VPEELTLQRQHGDEVSLAEVMKPINGDATNKNLLSMRQLSEPDIYGYITEAYAAEHYRNSPQRGLNLLPFHSLKAVMKQPSTRTGGSMTTAMQKLGGSADLISGMSASSEAKGESIPDSNIAFATQADIIGMRTAEEYGPMDAAREMIKAVRDEEIPFAVPVINLGDGRNEHPTQTLGDLFTMHKIFVDQRGGELSGKTLVTVGDQERYRAIHSLILGSVAVGMNVIAVESSVSRIPTS
jgi:aspartate carbamoyltransferase catalytic subunit